MCTSTARKPRINFPISAGFGSSALIAALLVVIPAGLLFAAEPWYIAYDQAKKAYDRKDYVVAEAKLLVALSQEPSSARNKRGAGVQMIEYFPDYYLGLTYFGEGKYEEARVQFDKVLKSKVFKSTDAEYASASLFLQQAESKLTEKPTPPPVDAKARETEDLIQNVKASIAAGNTSDSRRTLEVLRQKDPGNAAIVGLSDQITKLEKEDLEKQQASRQAQLNAYLIQAGTALNSGDFQKARDLVKEANDMGIDPGKVAAFLKELNQAEGLDLVRKAETALASKEYGRARQFSIEAENKDVPEERTREILKRIEIEENLEQGRVAMTRGDFARASAILKKVKALDPSNAEIKQMEENITARETSDSDDLYDQGVLAFLRGDYQNAASILQRLTGEKATAETHFFLGCTQAALYFSAENGDPKLLDTAKKEFAEARRLEPGFQIDTRFISPRILEVFRQSR